MYVTCFCYIGSSVGWKRQVFNLTLWLWICDSFNSLVMLNLFFNSG
jgi:hypothetical protein